MRFFRTSLIVLGLVSVYWMYITPKTLAGRCYHSQVPATDWHPEYTIQTYVHEVKGMKMLVLQNVIDMGSGYVQMMPVWVPLKVGKEFNCNVFLPGK